MTKSVLIVGVGSGLSASLARLCSKKNMTVVLATRNINKLKELKEETKATTYQCDSTNIESVSNLFLELDNTIGTPNLVIYNAAARVRGEITELNPIQTQEAINVTCLGAFLVAQEAAKRMLKKKSGSIFFTGATAGVKGFANSSVFAMGKFAQRGLAEMSFDTFKCVKSQEVDISASLSMILPQDYVNYTKLSWSDSS